ncbi:MAG TPA: DNA polymerase III subunit gamma/tau, partial [Nitrospiraceae bacterium]|nr:DNA polymerase III subunit gamma/tau [Nitrospiraceae bacterium]
MDYQVSARKYRPGTFDEVIGQPHVVQTLVNAISSKRIAHAFLFSGTRGVGKTTVARILAKSLNCEQGPTGMPCSVCASCIEITQGSSVDVIEIDGASNTSVDDVREIRENVKFTPFRGQYRVYIIDEVHMLSNSAFNALLKTLEEPPAHVIFIFATTEIHKIPATILSRCQHYNFRRISKAEIAARLRLVAERDGLQIEDRSLLALARASEGSMRDGLSLLDQVVAFGGLSISHGDLEALLGAVPQELVHAMAEAVLDQQSFKALHTIREVLDQGHDVRTYCGDVVEYVRNLLVAAVVPTLEEIKGLIEGSDEDIRQLKVDAARVTPDQLQEVLRIFTQAEDALRVSAHPRYVLEAAAVRATRLTLSKEPLTAEASSSKVRADRAGQPAADPAKQTKVASPSPPNFASPSGERGFNEKREAQVVSRSDIGTGTPTSPLPAGSPAIQTHRSGDDRRQSPHGDSDRAILSDSAGLSQVDARPRVAASVVPASLDWSIFQEAVSSEYPNIAPFLEMGRFLGLEGNQVLIGFAKQGTVGRAMLEKPDNIHALALLGERLVGCPL